MVDGGDAAGVGDVGEGVGGEDDEVGGVAGGDEAEVHGGVEGVEELAGVAGGQGDGLEGSEAGGDDVFELAVFGEARDAAGGGAGVGAEGDEDASVVEGLEVVLVVGEVLFGLGCLRGRLWWLRRSRGLWSLARSCGPAAARKKLLCMIWGWVA